MWGQYLLNKLYYKTFDTKRRLQKQLTNASIKNAFMAKLVRHLTSNEEIVSSNLAEGNFSFFLA